MIYHPYHAVIMLHVIPLISRLNFLIHFPHRRDLIRVLSHPLECHELIFSSSWVSLRVNLPASFTPLSLHYHTTIILVHVSLHSYASSSCSHSLMSYSLMSFSIISSKPAGNKSIVMTRAPYMMLPASPAYNDPYDVSHRCLHCIIASFLSRHWIRIISFV